MIQKGLGPPRSDEENLRIRREKLSYRGLFSWLRPDKRENIIEYSAAPIQVGERALTIGIDRDITERVQAERMLREYSERLEEMVEERTAEVQTQYARLEAILRSVGDAILMTDQDMRIRYVNPAFTALTGYTNEELLGQHVNSIESGVSSPQVQQSINSALAEEKVWHGEVTGRRKDGRTYDAALTIAPVHNAEGHLAGYVSSYQDIGQRKDLERARSRFITNISHQLRTPVTTIKLYVQLLQKREQTGESLYYLKMVEGEVNRLIDLIQDILEITRLDSNQIVAARHPISLSRVVEHAITRYRSQAESSGLTLATMPTPPDLPTVKGDQAWLTRALEEIVENAVIFTPPGGEVKVKVEVEVEVATTEDEGRTWATIAVRDTGPGILPEEQDKIFDRFFRGNLAESGHIPGTGLGLSIAQAIIQAHGGRVTTESEVGVGSTFTIWLPLADRPRPSDE